MNAFNEQHRAHAARYGQLFAQAGLSDWLQAPADVADRHTYHQYVIHLPDGQRDPVKAHLQEKEVGCGIYYPLPLHLQPCFAKHGGKVGDHPVAERCAKNGLALPIFPELTAAEQDEVVAALASARTAVDAD